MKIQRTKREILDAYFNFLVEIKNRIEENGGRVRINDYISKYSLYRSCSTVIQDAGIIEKTGSNSNPCWVWKWKGEITLKTARGVWDLCKKYEREKATKSNIKNVKNYKQKTLYYNFLKELRKEINNSGGYLSLSSFCKEKGVQKSTPMILKKLGITSYNEGRHKWEYKKHISFDTADMVYNELMRYNYKSVKRGRENTFLFNKTEEKPSIELIPEKTKNKKMEKQEKLESRENITPYFEDELNEEIPKKTKKIKIKLFGITVFSKEINE